MPAAPSAGGDVDMDMESATSEGQMGGGGAPAAAGGAFTRQDSFAESCDAGIPARAVP